MANNTILDLDAMMDIEMDKVETLPDYVTPPAGNYVLEVKKAEIAKTDAMPAKGDKPAKPAGSKIRIQYAIEEVLEVAGNELPPSTGSMFSEQFTGTEDGVKFFKRQAMNILNVKDLTGAKMKDVLDGLTGAKFKAKISIEKTKGDGDKVYENVRVRPVQEEQAA